MRGGVAAEEWAMQVVVTPQMRDEACRDVGGAKVVVRLRESPAMSAHGRSGMYRKEGLLLTQARDRAKRMLKSSGRVDVIGSVVPGSGDFAPTRVVDRSRVAPDPNVDSSALEHIQHRPTSPPHCLPTRKLRLRPPLGPARKLGRRRERSGRTC